jgi:hypothetical protein
MLALFAQVLKETAERYVFEIRGLRIEKDSRHQNSQFAVSETFKTAHPFCRKTRPTFRAPFRAGVSAKNGSGPTGKAVPEAAVQRPAWKE